MNYCSELSPRLFQILRVRNISTRNVHRARGCLRKFWRKIWHVSNVSRFCDRFPCREWNENIWNRDFEILSLSHVCGNLSSQLWRMYNTIHHLADLTYILTRGKYCFLKGNGGSSRWENWKFRIQQREKINTRQIYENLVRQTFMKSSHLCYSFLVSASSHTWSFSWIVQSTARLNTNRETRPSILEPARHYWRRNLEKKRGKKKGTSQSGKEKFFSYWDHPPRSRKIIS